MARKSNKRGGENAGKSETKSVKKTTKPESVKASAKKSTAKVADKKVVPKAVAPVATAPVKAVADKGNAFKKFFERKYEGKENVDSLFGSPKLIAALVAEILGSFVLVMATLTTNASPLFVMFGALAAALLIYRISGAMINPVITLGALVTRRISAIRAVFYIIAQVLGAMLAYIALKSFMGNTGAEEEMMMMGAPTLFSMAPIPEGALWSVVAIEAIGAALLAIFFARAIQSKKSPFTFGAIFAGGIFIATIFAMSAAGYISAGFALNPALAVAMEAFTAVPEDFAVNALAFIVAPIVGGIAGFVISDLMTRAAGVQEA